MMKTTFQYLFAVCALLVGLQLQGYGRAQSANLSSSASFATTVADQQPPSAEFSNAIQATRDRLSVLLEPSSIVEMVIADEEEEKWREGIVQQDQNHSHQLAFLIRLLAKNLDAVHQSMPSDGDTAHGTSSKTRCLTYCLLRI